MTCPMGPTANWFMIKAMPPSIRRTTACDKEEDIRARMSGSIDFKMHILTSHVVKKFPNVHKR